MANVLISILSLSRFVYILLAPMGPYAELTKDLLCGGPHN